MSKQPGRLASLASRFWVDALCMLAALAFFGFFLRNSLIISSGALGYRTKVGNLMSGTVNRKSVDAPVFTEITPEAAIFDRDAIWTPSNSGLVQIRLIDQTLFDISPGTLVVLKKAENLKAPGLSVDVVAGSVEIREVSRQVGVGLTQFKIGDKPMPASELGKGAKLSTIRETRGSAPSAQPSASPAPLPSPSPAPDASASPVPSAIPGEPGQEDAPAPAASPEALFYPREGMRFYVMTRKRIEVAFSWPSKHAGDLVIRKLSGSAQQAEVRVPKARALATRVPLAVGAQYEWRIQGTGGRPAFGPHRFGIEEYSGQQVMETMGGSDGLVEIVQ
jgi:hypothetical protein